MLDHPPDDGPGFVPFDRPETIRKIQEHLRAIRDENDWVGAYHPANPEEILDALEQVTPALQNAYADLRSAESARDYYRQTLQEREDDHKKIIEGKDRYDRRARKALRDTNEQLRSEIAQLRADLAGLRHVQSESVPDRVCAIVAGSIPEDWHRHPNGGGWVHSGATVHREAFVAPGAIVSGSAVVDEGSHVGDLAQVGGRATIESSTLSGMVHIGGNAIITGSNIAGNAQVCEDARVQGGRVVQHAAIWGRADVRHSWIAGSTVLRGDVLVVNATLFGGTHGDGKISGTPLQIYNPSTNSWHVIRAKGDGPTRVTTNHFTFPEKTLAEYCKELGRADPTRHRDLIAIMIALRNARNEAPTDAATRNGRARRHLAL